MKLKNDAWFGSQKTFSTTHTLLSHIENLITGLTKGYRYKMRFVYAHFPINARIGNNKKYIEIRNFLGEKKLLFYFQFIYLISLPFATRKKIVLLGLVIDVVTMCIIIR